MILRLDSPYLLGFRDPGLAADSPSIVCELLASGRMSIALSQLAAKALDKALSSFNRDHHPCNNGTFSTRDLLLIAYAGWMGLCVYVAELLDGNRAYAAILSGYTMGLVAIREIGNQGHVFEAAMMRGARPSVRK